MVYGSRSGCNPGRPSAADGSGSSPSPGRITPSLRPWEYLYERELSSALANREGMQVSMSRTADCYDNAAMESFFHSFKGECIDFQSFPTRAQARSSTVENIEGFYNRTRRHSTLQYMSPLLYEPMIG